MNIQDKSKEELIIELQELQRENESLKSFYNTSINELRQSEKVLQDIIAKNPMSIQIIDKDGFTLLINSAHTKLFGAVPPNNYSVFTDPMLHKIGFTDLLSRAKAGEVVLFPDFYYNVHDLFLEFADVPVWIRMVIFPLLDKYGKPERYVLMHENITYRKQAEDALRESEENHRNLLELAPHAFFQGDLKGNIILANEKASVLTGFSKEELLRKNMRDFFSPSVLNNIPLRYDLLDKGETITIEREVTRKDGSTVIVEMRSRKMPNNTYQSFMSDISQRKQAEAMLQKKNEEIEAQNKEYEELNDKLIQTNLELSLSKAQIEVSEEKFRLMIKNSNDAFVLINEQGEQFYISDASTRDTGFTVEELKGPIQNVIYPDDLDIVLKAWNEVLEKKDEVVRVQYRHKHKFKDYIWYEAVAQNFIDNPLIKAVVVNVRDITQIKETEIELRKAKDEAEENERKYRLVFENVPLGIIHYNNKGEILSCNDRFVEIIGSTKEVLIGLNMTKLPDKNILLALNQSLSGSLGFYYDDYHSVTADKITPVQIIFAPIFSKKNEVIGGVGIVEDVTERKRNEEKLKKQNEEYLALNEELQQANEKLYIAKQIAEENEAKYSSIVKILPDGVVIHTAGKIVFMNDAALKIVKGKRFDDFIGQPAINFVHPDYRELALERIKNSFVDKKYAELVEEAFIDSEGNTVNVLVAGSPFKYQGQPSMLTVFTDISRIKVAEQELIKAKEKAEENEKKFRVLVETSPDVIALTDIEGRHIFRNAAYYESLGFSVDEDVPLDGFARVHPEDILLVKESMKQLMSQGIMKGEYRVLHKEGYWVYRQTIAKIIYNEHNEPHQILTIMRDITDNKKAEHELIKAKEKAVESDRLKTAFLANMSHEIRTPMNGILGFAELLKRPQLSGEQQQEYIKIIEKSGVRMLNIINDIIDISKIESGETKVSYSQTNINDQIDFVYKFFKPEVEQKGLKLVIKSSLPSYQAFIDTDREKIYAILTNLVKNAIKFTESGSIELGCKSDGILLRFYVRDTGIGIPRNRQYAIFERFVQADISDSRAFQGAGLGLAITKAYVEMLGGEIWFESDEGKGTTFFFTIPYVAEKVQEPIQQSSNEPQISKIKKLKVLIAEDDEASDLFITLMLGKYNCDVLHANNGLKTVDICRETPDIDLIMMDIKMPYLNGHDAARQIRQFNKNVIIIAQTAHALTGDKEKAIEAGCNDYISKPLNQERFGDLMMKYFSM